jgi:hypothetical protein
MNSEVGQIVAIFWTPDPSLAILRGIAKKLMMPMTALLFSQHGEKAPPTTSDRGL